MNAALSAQRRPPRSGEAARHLIVFLHGYGADGADLIGLAEPFAQTLPHAEFVAPNAPGFTPMGGREWFPLTMRDPSEYARGVVAAAPALQATLDAELARLSLDETALGLVGFSQGTMMALHAGYQRARPLAAIVGFSGLCPEPEPTLAHPAPTLLVHGTADEVIPAAMTLAAAHSLGAAGVPVEWHLVPGLPHSIDPGGIAMAADHLARYLPGGTHRRQTL